jgi:hypothetical protein
MTMPCSLRGTNIEVMHNPTVGTSIMSEFLAKNLLGNMPIVPTEKLFKSPLGLFFECCAIARAVPIIIDKIKVFIDFHIFTILEFDLLIGYPIENLFKEKPILGSHDEKLGKTASAIPILCPKSPMAFISPFISPRVPSETKCPSSPSLEMKPCPSGQHDITLEKENFWAMDKLIAPTLELEMNDSTNEHECSSFEFPRDSCSLLESPEFVVLSTACSYEDHNHLLIFVSKLFSGWLWMSSFTASIANPIVVL